MVFVSGNSRVWFRMEGYEALECLSNCRRLRFSSRLWFTDTTERPSAASWPSSFWIF